MVTPSEMIANEQPEPSKKLFLFYFSFALKCSVKIENFLVFFHLIKLLLRL